MDIRAIKTKQQYRRYLEEVDRLVALDPHPRTAEGAWLELLAKLVEDYEKEHFKFRKPDPENRLERKPRKTKRAA